MPRDLCPYCFRPCRACRPCSVNSTGRCTGTTRPDEPASLGRLARVEGRIGASWVARDAACQRELTVVVGSVPVARPLPDVPGHVVEAVAVRSELRHRPGARVSILASISIREVPLKRVGHLVTARRELVAPRIEFTAQPTSSGELPLRFGRQAFAGPLCKGDRVGVRDLHHRVLFATREATFGAIGPTTPAAATGAPAGRALSAFV